jgi:phosphate butyryltransferase
VLVGDADKITVKAGEIGLDCGQLSVINCPESKEACQKAVAMVSSGQGDILMKGLVDTSVIMKAILDRETGLRNGTLISHITMIEAESLGRLIFVTDGAINIKPDLTQKREIIQNAIIAAHNLGYEQPKVAVLAALEKISEKMPETIEAAALSKMGDRGQITGGIVDGPLAIDNALSEESARIKGIESQVAGQADILFTPEIIAGNILGKSPVYFAGGRIAAIIGGTSSPVVITSRASKPETKLVSIAASVLMVD